MTVMLLVTACAKLLLSFVNGCCCRQCDDGVTGALKCCLCDLTLALNYDSNYNFRNCLFCGHVFDVAVIVVAILMFTVTI